MKRDDIKDMIAKVYGVVWANEAQLKDLAKFAALVASAEREACAKVVEAWSDWHGGTETLAKAIRAREQA